MILEFVELDDFVEELKSLCIANVRIEIETEYGTPRGEMGNASFVAKATATALENDTTIIRCSRDILVSDTLSLRVDKEASRERMFNNFELVRTELTQCGFGVKRGMWKP